MAKRMRSPNYPSISLADAVERLTKLGGAIHGHAAPRDIVLTSMGYSGANGASLTALSALGKYGLLERTGDEYKITQRGMMYLHPQSPEERQRAIQEAAAEPKVFADLSERFSGGGVSDELLRNYLVRSSFSPTAAASALLAYRETMALVERECGEYDTEDTELEVETPPLEPSPTPMAARGKPAPSPAVVTPPGKFRVSMTDEFLVDVAAASLNRAGVERLVAWLQANVDLVPNEEPTSDVIDAFEDGGDAKRE